MESKVGIVVWESLNPEQIIEIISNQQKNLGLLTKADLCSESNSNSMKSRIELDMYRYAIKYCVDQKYSLEQISALVSILKRVHTCCHSTPYDNYTEAMNLFQQLLTYHSINHIPFCTALFSAQQCSSLLDYFTLTYFAHFYLYKYVFTCKPSLTLRLLNIPIRDCASSSPIEETEDSGEKDLTTTNSLVEKGTNSDNISNDFDSGEHNIMGVVSNIITPKIAKVQQNILEEMKNREDTIDKKLLSLEKSVHTKK